MGMVKPYVGYDGYDGYDGYVGYVGYVGYAERTDAVGFFNGGLDALSAFGRAIC
jgi:hypothetical protein